jgi:hypothetical protein
MKYFTVLCAALRFSPDDVEAALTKELALAETPKSPAPCDCGTSFLQLKRAPDTPGCDCGIEDVFEPPPPPEDGERLLVDQCELIKKDIDFWDLGQTKFHPDGIVLDHTVGYTDTCDGCTKHNLKCLNAPTTIEPGYCLCMWRTDGAEPMTSLLACGDCVTNCIGKFTTFPMGQAHTPEMTNGLCIRKKGYTR